MRHLLALLAIIPPAFATMLGAPTPSSGLAAEDRASTAIAVFDFNYIDTSGEVRDQRSEHAARLDRFMSALKGDLAAQPKFRVVVPVCGAEPCSLAQSTQSDILDAARAAGADLLVIGTIHKMSTLVQWANVEAIDAKTGKILVDKLFSFRGDSDEAWARAETFIAGEITTLGASP